MVLAKRFIRDLLIGQVVVNVVLLFTILDYAFGRRIFGEYVVVVLTGVLLFYTVLVYFLYTHIG